MSSEVYAHCVGILQNCFTLRKTLCDVHSFVPSAHDNSGSLSDLLCATCHIMNYTVHSGWLVSFA